MVKLFDFVKYFESLLSNWVN